MCKAPKPPPAPVAEKPRYLVNPVLDSPTHSTIGQLRLGRSSLRTDLTIRQPNVTNSGPGLGQTADNIELADRRARTPDLIDRLRGINVVM